MAIFAGFIAMVATGVVPTVVAGVTAAIAMVATGVMNIRVATRALDTKVFTMIPAGLALGAALEKTGAPYLADNLVLALDGFGNLAILSAFFLFVAVLTNVISSKACAVLFTPIGVDLAHTMGVDPHVFAVALLMSANCAFATPIGYQVNLLVMGPGHYRFRTLPCRRAAGCFALGRFTAIAHFITVFDPAWPVPRPIWKSTAAAMEARSREGADLPLIEEANPDRAFDGGQILAPAMARFQSSIEGDKLIAAPALGL